MTNTSNNPHISVVSPVYGCPGALNELCERLHATLGLITESYEILLVNDASPDNSWEIIKEQARKDPRVKGINLSRNFGQHYAITAGLDFAAGEWVVVMDCDLQDLPEEIRNLYITAKFGFEIVVARRANRKDSPLTIALSRLFYLLFKQLTNTKLDHNVANFGIYSHRVVKVLQTFKERSRSFGIMVNSIGLRKTEIDVLHGVRRHGRSSYSFYKKLNFALDNILNHSDKLLVLTVKLGIFISVTSILVAGAMIVRYFLFPSEIIGWPSLIVSLFLSTGLILGAIGIVGLYVGKIYNETKQRPLYILQEITFNCKTPGNSRRGSPPNAVKEEL